MSGDNSSANIAEASTSWPGGYGPVSIGNSLLGLNGIGRCGLSIYGWNP